MKRLFYLILTITLPLIAYFQYQQFRRFHPPQDFQWVIPTGIDTAYYDPEVLLRYYQYAEETGTYARWAWAEHDLDVLAPDRRDPEAQTILRRYERYRAVLRQLQQRLLRSSQLKAQGLTNADIRRLEQGGPPPPHPLEQADLPLAQRGDESLLVRRLQELLRQRGYGLRIDGVFDEETQGTLRQFQQKEGLSPTGKLDVATLMELLP